MGRRWVWAEQAATFGERLGRCIVLLGIGAYRAALAPQLVGACRFTPSCSRYAEEAILRYGLWRGGALAIARLARCHPFHSSVHAGWDPVPETQRR